MSGGEDMLVTNEGAATEGLTQSPVCQSDNPRKLIWLRLRSPNDSARFLCMVTSERRELYFSACMPWFVLHFQETFFSFLSNAALARFVEHQGTGGDLRHHEYEPHRHRQQHFSHSRSSNYATGSEPRSPEGLSRSSHFISAFLVDSANDKTLSGGSIQQEKPLPKILPILKRTPVQTVIGESIYMQS